MLVVDTNSLEEGGGYRRRSEGEEEEEGGEEEGEEEEEGEKEEEEEGEEGEERIIQQDVAAQPISPICDFVGPLPAAAERNKAEGLPCQHHQHTTRLTGSILPNSRFKKVDFPIPFGPTMATESKVRRNSNHAQVH